MHFSVRLTGLLASDEYKFRLSLACQVQKAGSRSRFFWICFLSLFELRPQNPQQVAQL
jgi:hypothetical protein